MPDSSKPSFWSMAAAEPFRIFFPLGVLAGISGVSLWPLFFSGIHHSFYPGVMHARLMIEGFMGAFIVGFLGTAAPRLTGTPTLSGTELSTLLALFITTVATHISERYLVADFIFLGLLLTFAVLMGSRFRQRDDLPPPSFVLVAFGFLNAIAGTVLLIASGRSDGAPQAAILGNLLLYQGFVLYLVLGIGGFLLPRFLQLPQPAFPESRTPSAEWLRHAGVALAAGALLLTSLVLEVFSPWFRSAAVLRFGTAAAFLFWQIPFLRSEPGLTIIRCLKLSLVLLIFGLAFPGFWPAQRVAGLHLVFIGGFTLITFTVATRVVLGHSGQSHRFTTRLSFLVATAVLLLLAAVLRVVGDFTLSVRGSLLSYASYLWILAAAVWGWRVLPSVRRPDTES
ncbi:NnrS family protein [Verrucomicrobiota bacterium sgz303538]